MWGAAMCSVTLTAAGPAVRPTGLSRRAIATVDLALACLTLVKRKIVSLVLFTSVVACVVAGHGPPVWPALAVLVLSGLLSAGGAAALNHYFDRDIDARMERTRSRPLPGGQIDVPTIAGGSDHLAHAEQHDLRGTLTLTLIFLGLFLVIYATHWINLASLWRIG